jgi:hypothetical protein
LGIGRRPEGRARPDEGRHEERGAGRVAGALAEERPEMNPPCPVRVARDEARRDLGVTLGGDQRRDRGRAGRGEEDPELARREQGREDRLRQKARARTRDTHE